MLLMSVAYWTNGIVDPDQKSALSQGQDGNENFQIFYKNHEAAELVAQGRVELAAQAVPLRAWSGRAPARRAVR